MAGYSGTPLDRKLGIKAGHRVLLWRAPPGFEPSLGLPAGVRVARDLRGRGPYDVIVAFAESRADVATSWAALEARLDPGGGLWIAWPKKSSGVTTDLTEDALREVALARGLVDNKVCAIDAVWSGLRLVVRRENRPSKKPAPR